MTLWSLTSRSVAYVPHPKSCDVSFTPDGAFLAVIERKVLQTTFLFNFHNVLHLTLVPPSQDSIDFLSIFCNASGWVLAKRTQLPTRDCSGCVWSPDGTMSAVWDRVLECRLAAHTSHLVTAADSISPHA